jgi:hypothetical protein
MQDVFKSLSRNMTLRRHAKTISLIANNLRENA